MHRIWKSAPISRQSLRLFIVVLILSGTACSSTSAAYDPALWCEFAVSPDGSKIAYPVPAYDEYADQVTEVWTAALDGSGAVKLSTVRGNYNVSWLDNSNVICTQFDADILPVISVGKGDIRTLQLTDQFFWTQPSTIPGGKWVAFTGVQKEPQEAGIWVLDVKSGEIKRISSDIVKSYVSWSPDGTKFVYGAGAYQKDYQLKLADVVAGDVIDLGLNGVGAAWSSDGKWLAYTGRVVSGGSWMAGIPTCGSIVKANIDTRTETVLTEPGIYKYDRSEDRLETMGAMNPQWSPDGKFIAYRRMHSISRDEIFEEDAIWVVGVEGGAKRVAKVGPFQWTPDSKALLIKQSSGIVRVPLEGGAEQAVVSWKAPTAPEVKDSDWKTVEEGSAVVEYALVRPEYVRALAKVASESRRVYAEEFGFAMPQKVFLRIEKNPQGNANLWTDGESRMFLTISSNADLKPPMESGVFNIYGVAHELAHIAMYSSLSRNLGVADGVAQGWAHYAGSLAVDKVYAKLGPDVWPDPYNYSESEGMARLASQAERGGSTSAEQKAATMFYEIDRKYGAGTSAVAMKNALAGKPEGKDLMARFAGALTEVTKDQSASELVPKEILTAQVRWNVSQRRPNDATFEGITTTEESGGVLLKYDDGESDDMLSTAGSGHAVIFRAPEGSWALDYIEIYASRYGAEEPPAENFLIFVCDENFEVVGEVEKPYSTFERSDPKWYKISFDPIKTPQVFYVCVYFNPTATKGVYVHYDTDVAKSHSKSALPWSHVSDVNEEFDWMIRAHLVKAE